MVRIWSRLASGAAILAVASVAGLISYTHIYDLTLALHQSVLAARLMPVAIDGLILMGSVVLLQSGSRLGWLGVGPGVALSLFANIESGVRYGPLSAVWAAIPSVSFFLATFIFERWLIAQAKGAGIPSPVATAETVAEVEPVPEIVPMPRARTAASPATVPRAQTLASGRARGRARGNASKAPARVFAAELERGELPSLREVKRRAKVGTDKGKLILSDLRAVLDAQPVDQVVSDAA
jgi:hypothetical protein